MCERVRGARLSDREAESAAVAIGTGLRGRDRLLALMDLGATVCTARTPACDALPARRALRDARPARRRDEAPPRPRSRVRSASGAAT